MRLNGVCPLTCLLAEELLNVDMAPFRDAATDYGLVCIGQIAYRESGRFALSPEPCRPQNSSMNTAIANRTLKPREKLQQLGAASLTDAELIAIFLRTGGRRGSGR